MLRHGDGLARGSLPRERGPPPHPSRYPTSPGLGSGEGGPWTGVVKLLHHRTSQPYKTEADFYEKNILMQAGDVERNPGPRDTQTPKKCDSCGLTMKRTIKNPLTCLLPNCENVCHDAKKCSNLSRSKIEKDKSENRQTWTCKLHRTAQPEVQDEDGETRITTEEVVAPIEAPRKKCDRCE